MKKIFTLILAFAMAAALFAGIPHPVFVEYTGSPVSFGAYLGTDTSMENVLYDTSIGCGILTDPDLIMVECGNFPEWEYADVLYIVLTYPDYTYQYSQVILDYDNVQALTGEDAIWFDGIPGGEVTQEGVFAPGWNLWSYNVLLENHAVDVVLQDMMYLTKVKSITQSYDPSLDPMFNTLEFLEDGYGYWVQVSDEDYLELTGAPIPLTTEIALGVGWNLVAFLPQVMEDVEYAFEALIPPAGTQLLKVKSITQSYDPSLDPMFNTLETLHPGNGYWVRVGTAVDFTYPDPPARSINEEAVSNYVWTPVIYTNSTCAYGYTTATEGYVGAFVAGECRGIADVREGTVSFVINGEAIEEVSFQLYQNGKVYTANTTITTDPGNDVSGFELDFTTNIPVSTKLVNAYPNPFNPETTIAYDVAIAGNVNVSVYNIKGQKVAELENGHKDAGQYNIVWKADNNASGIYFVRMNAAGTDQIQKVVLMK
ncbi:MAG: T9SS type A sorting domain-containing protein [Candidatus Cloacimonetes bacterium]|nr:T9SS type A sorting domain-containing protein [Candidatus Cloacimonadota bacterium]